MIVLKSENNSMRGFRIDLDVPIKTMKLCGLSSQHNLYEIRRNSYLCIVFISFFFSIMFYQWCQQKILFFPSRSISDASRSFFTKIFQKWYNAKGSEEVCAFQNFSSLNSYFSWHSSFHSGISLPHSSSPPSHCLPHTVTTVQSFNKSDLGSRF